MKKLNQTQKEKIMKNYPTLTHLVIKYVEKLGDENTNLNDDIMLALDIIKEKQ